MIASFFFFFFFKKGGGKGIKLTGEGEKSHIGIRAGEKRIEIQTEGYLHFTIIHCLLPKPVRQPPNYYLNVHIDDASLSGIKSKVREHFCFRKYGSCRCMELMTCIKLVAGSLTVGFASRQETE